MTAQPPSSTTASWASGQVTAHTYCVLAPNPGPMTLDGTNTWVVMAPEAEEAIVIDPGPLDEAHLAEVVRLVRDRGARVTQTILTHHHLDHSEAGPRFRDLTGSRLRAVGRGHDDLADGDVVTAAGVELRVVATPGHTADSVSFALEADHALLTGDTVLGRGTTVVAHPDGELAAYLDSLERIKAMTGDGAVATILPGHGPAVPDAADMITYYRRHRQERLEQVRAALEGGPPDVGDEVEMVLSRVYADVPESVWPAARLSIRAQLDYLRRA